MDNQTAIDYLNGLVSDGIVDSATEQQVIDLSLEALNKQVPKAPVRCKGAVSRCPGCSRVLGDWLGKDTDGYYTDWIELEICDCGQQLDWDLIIEIDHIELAASHHKDIVKMGYWDEPANIGVLLMLITTEITKLFDEAKLNKPEKLADVALRLYDFAGNYGVDLSELPVVDDCGIWDMMNTLTCEMEAYRVDMDTNYRYIKECLAMCYQYADQNDINLEFEIDRKRDMLKLLTKKKI